MIQRICLFIFPLYLLSCSNKTPEPTVAREHNMISGWSEYKNEGYSIQYPHNWLMTHATEDPFVLYNTTDPVISMSNILLQVFPRNEEGMSLDVYMEEFEDNFEKTFKTGAIVSSKEMRFTNDRYNVMVYTYPYMMSEFKAKTCTWYKNGKIYKLTFTGRSPARFDELVHEANKIMETFWIEG